MKEDRYFKWPSKPLCICLYLDLNPRPLIQEICLYIYIYFFSITEVILGPGPKDKRTSFLKKIILNHLFFSNSIFMKLAIYPVYLLPIC